MNTFYEKQYDDFRCRKYFAGEKRLDKEPHLHYHIELVALVKGKTEAYADIEKCVIEGGDVFFAFPNAIHRYVSFDTEKLAYSSKTKLSSLSGSVNYDVSDAKIYFSLADSENLTVAESLFSVVFSYTECVNTKVHLTITDIYDQDYNNEVYTIIGGDVIIG